MSKLDDRIQWRIPLVYVIFAGLWILLSDRVLEFFTTDSVRLSQLQTYKGWFYVLMTSILLFALLRKELNLRNRVERERFHLQIQEQLARSQVQEEQERYKDLFQASPMPMWVYDLETLAFLSVNEAATDHYGYPRDEFLNMTIRDIHLYGDIPSLEQTIRDQPGRLRKPGVWRQKKADGTLMEVEITTHDLIFNDRNARLVLANDVTEALRAERLLHETNETLQAIVRSSPLAILMVDIETRVRMWNPAAAHIFGWTEAEIIGNPLPIIPAERQSEYLRIRDLLEKGEVVTNVETRRLRKDGTLLDVSLSTAPLRDTRGDVRGYMAVFADISNSKLAEAELKEAETGLRRYADRLKVLHVIDRDILAAELPFVIAQTALHHLCSLVDCPRASVAIMDETVGEATILAISADQPVSLSAGMQTLVEQYADLNKLRSGEWFQVNDLKALAAPSPLQQNMLADGIRSYVSIPLLYRNKLMGTLNLAWKIPGDIRDENLEAAQEVAGQMTLAIQQSRLLAQVRAHAAQLERRVAERTAELEDKNRELETFTYSVSHDLKAPLRGIDGYSRLLLEEHAASLNEEGRTFLETIRKATQQMNRLIQDLLEYSRLERRPLAYRQANLRNLVSILVAERSDAYHASGIEVKMDIPDLELTIETDGFSQALRNLLDNAIKFTQTVEHPLIEVGSEIGENTIRLWVRDNGVGFDMKYHDRIFEIFHRLHRAEEYSGTGIGLAIVEKVMNRMKGRAWAQSVPGAGSTFFLEVPR